MDKYDKQIARLRKNPKRIEGEWTSAIGLFCWASSTGDMFDVKYDKNCSCLTMIRGGGCEACTDELTEAIRSDERLPSCVDDITVGHLPVFAEWQRRLDAEFGRSKP